MELLFGIFVLAPYVIIITQKGSIRNTVGDAISLVILNGSSLLLCMWLASMISKGVFPLLVAFVVQAIFIYLTLRHTGRLGNRKNGRKL